MRGTPAANNVHAKTGTLNMVRALSGYVTTRDGRTLLFSLLANHFTVPTRDVDALHEAIVVRLAGFGEARADARWQKPSREVIVPLPVGGCPCSTSAPVLASPRWRRTRCLLGQLRDGRVRRARTDLVPGCDCAAGTVAAVHSPPCRCAPGIAHHDRGSFARGRTAWCAWRTQRRRGGVIIRDRGKNVPAARGEDLGWRHGARGGAIAPAQVDVLATLGMPAVDVHRRPVVAILGSGDELDDLDPSAGARRPQDRLLQPVPSRRSCA
jgi:hypothetical protein